MNTAEPVATMRAEFEAWFATTRHREDATDGALSYRAKAIQWQAWQAAWSRAPSAEAKDAARYRWLRDPTRIPAGEAMDEGDGHVVVADAGGEDVMWLAELDARIDGAIAQQGAAAAQDPDHG